MREQKSVAGETSKKSATDGTDIYGFSKSKTKGIGDLMRRHARKEEHEGMKKVEERNRRF